MQLLVHHLFDGNDSGLKLLIFRLEVVLLAGASACFLIACLSEVLYSSV
jgi:hypothetical protein